MGQCCSVTHQHSEHSSRAQRNQRTHNPLTHTHTITHKLHTCTGRADTHKTHTLSAVIKPPHPINTTIHTMQYNRWQLRAGALQSRRSPVFPEIKLRLQDADVSGALQRVLLGRHQNETRDQHTAEWADQRLLINALH